LPVCLPREAQEVFWVVTFAIQKRLHALASLLFCTARFAHLTGGDMDAIR
jgi:hypothetical protein